MNNKNDNLKSSGSNTEKKKKDNPEGYPLYPESEDIYERLEEEKDLNPENTSKTKTSAGTNALRKRALDKKTRLGEQDLDVPGAELDDADEDIGNEDEENNYYSLGGDDHEDLEEDRGV